MESTLQAQLQPLNQKLAEARDGLDHLNSRALAFIKERPGTCLLGAIAIGFIIGRLAARA
jgi:hypothetical protein